ncbi:MAG: hypothetical protein QXV51_01615 [Thermosphaera sp.]
MGCFKEGVLRRGLKVVLASSTCILAGLLAGFTLTVEKILTMLPNPLGLGVSVALGFALLPFASFILHVVVDSALILRSPSYFRERGLEVCA